MPKVVALQLLLPSLPTEADEVNTPRALAPSKQERIELNSVPPSACLYRHHQARLCRGSG
jgi:hypothetical protein